MPRPPRAADNENSSLSSSENCSSWSEDQNFSGGEGVVDGVGLAVKDARSGVNGGH